LQREEEEEPKEEHFPKKLGRKFPKDKREEITMK
jgi:hypothetical protein